MSLQLNQLSLDRLKKVDNCYPNRNFYRHFNIRSKSISRLGTWSFKKEDDSIQFIKYPIYTILTQIVAFFFRLEQDKQPTSTVWLQETIKYKNSAEPEEIPLASSTGQLIGTIY